MYSKTANYRQRTTEGFTLLEILIALAIIGVTLVTVLHTANFNAGIASDGTVITQMTQEAKEKLFGLEDNPVNSSGDIEGTGFTYENTVTLADDERTAELKTVVRGQGKEVVLSEIIRAPEKER